VKKPIDPAAMLDVLRYAATALQEDATFDGITLTDDTEFDVTPARRRAMRALAKELRERARRKA
jgi:hypothetical protein